MAEVWYPRRAGTIQGNSSGSWVSGYPARGVLHTTEGSTASGATSAYSKNNSWPHFTLSETAKVYQHLAINVAARALKNLAGGVETNRAHAIQIEIVGFAAKPATYSVAQWDALRNLMRWIEQNAGVKPEGPGRAFATKYGQKELRFTNAEWYNFNGWCGHCHVPENDHWDPGAIDLPSLLKPTEVRPMYDPPFSIPGGVAAHLKAPGGGVWVLGHEGHIYAFDAPHLGQPAGKPYWVGRKAARLEAVGDEYRVIATSGESYGPGF